MFICLSICPRANTTHRQIIELTDNVYCQEMYTQWTKKRCHFYFWDIVGFCWPIFLRFLPFQSETINVYICIKFCHLTLIAMLHYLTESQCTKSQHFLCIFTAKYEVFEHVSHAKQALRWPLTMSEFTQCARNDRYSYEQMLFLSEITGKGQCQWHAKNKNKCKTR